MIVSKSRSNRWDVRTIYEQITRPQKKYNTHSGPQKKPSSDKNTVLMDKGKLEMKANTTQTDPTGTPTKFPSMEKAPLKQGITFPTLRHKDKNPRVGRKGEKKEKAQELGKYRQTKVFIPVGEHLHPRSHSPMATNSTRDLSIRRPCLRPGKESKLCK
jgi:hypothetical protein